MKIRKKIVLLVSCISLFFCLMIVNSTYAKYMNSTQGNTNLTIARWRILVNDEDIRDNPSITQTLTPVLNGNEHINPGVIAPTSSGYFDIIIDSSSVDVSFKYNISTSVSDNSCVKDLVVTGYSLNDGEVVSISSGEVISNDILYSDNITNTNIRMYIEWIDDDRQTMDNFDDADATVNPDCKGMVDVSLNFVQIKN